MSSVGNSEDETAAQAFGKRAKVGWRERRVVFARQHQSGNVADDWFLVSRVMPASRPLLTWKRKHFLCTKTFCPDRFRILGRSRELLRRRGIHALAANHGIGHGTVWWDTIFVQRLQFGLFPFEHRRIVAVAQVIDQAWHLTRGGLADGTNKVSAVEAKRKTVAGDRVGRSQRHRRAVQPFDQTVIDTLHQDMPSGRRDRLRRPPRYA